MPKAYDRVKNADNRSDVFIKTPYWTPDVEDSFEGWATAQGETCMASLLDSLLGHGVAVSFKEMNGSICCTLANQASKEADLPYLLTGWSDGAHDALFVALFKLEVQLKGVWQELEQPKPSRRH